MTRTWSFREEKDVITSIHRGRNERDESRREFRFIFEISLIEFNEKKKNKLHRRKREGGEEKDLSVSGSVDRSG